MREADFTSRPKLSGDFTEITLAHEIELLIPLTKRNSTDSVFCASNANKKIRLREKIVCCNAIRKSAFSVF
jgi:hypothetical protein